MSLHGFQLRNYGLLSIRLSCDSPYGTRPQGVAFFLFKYEDFLFINFHFGLAFSSSL